MDRATWIWFPGDYEIWLGNRTNNLRTERGTFFPPFWKTDSHYVTVEFSIFVDLADEEEISICAEGRYNVKVDGQFIFGMPSSLVVPQGHHSICIKVHNQATPPTLFVDGSTIRSGNSWRVTPEDLEWIDESGKASDKSATIYYAPGSWNFCPADYKPSDFRLKTKPIRPTTINELPRGGGRLYDFGRETFGYAIIEGIEGFGELDIYYGESAEEAVDKKWCETLDKLLVDGEGVTDLSTGSRDALKDGAYTLYLSKAFRYIYVEAVEGLSYVGLSALYEYLPGESRGRFRCSDEEINRIWDVGEYTLLLTTREVFIDGIKRDRWAWSGDARQSYLMDFYLSFDTDCVKRTSWLLRGKDPVTSHVNTIVDYSFFWFIGIYDYYLYSGDLAFVKSIYPRMKSLMDWILGRTDADGLVTGRSGDWVFVDWADGPMSKKGELSFEQVLFARSLEVTSLCASMAGDDEYADSAGRKAEYVRSKLADFWDEGRHALVHNIEGSVKSSEVTRYANIFAVLFDYLSQDRKDAVARDVLHNDGVMGITTPYMRFYELEALCLLGEQNDVLREIKTYWGGMLREGATTFWEKYRPSDKGREHFSMYGKPYRKSLCHAWGASPLYLLGRYFTGVYPTAPGYASFDVKPSLGGLEWLEGTVPVPNGEISVRMDRTSICVTAPYGHGTLYFNSEAEPVCPLPCFHLGGTSYSLHFEGGHGPVRVCYTVLPNL